MKTYFIHPKGNWSSRTERQYIGHTKKDAIKLYKKEFPQYTISELEIGNKPYFTF